MAHMGRPRESPIDSFGQVPEPLAVNPTIATVNALKDRRWTCADDELAGLRMLDDAPRLLVQNSIVDLLPSLATVIAPLHARSTGHRVNTLTILSVNHRRRSDCTFAMQSQWTKVVLFCFFFGQVQSVFSANIKNSIRVWRHRLLLLL